ncbi:hypothetical protein O4H49_03715 [Kiloniella laminariae]|uniref:Protein-tyrosine-phosphatase n=1 Tax=Kiloniella laminariae TaxID=454162 RepID=A0ABT4LHN2_9PROT|nr:hypothetical protein [Kiloniella laminariae]MCZ4279871.1 hypothetical protein [Kiloniella laminariae]
MQKLLFICSKNKWRSPTAETLLRKYPQFSVRSAGTASGARRCLSGDDILWADMIFVMEQKHKKRLLTDFRDFLEDTPLHVLDIPDHYQYMDPELVEILEQSFEGYLEI